MHILSFLNIDSIAVYFSTNLFGESMNFQNSCVYCLFSSRN